MRISVRYLPLSTSLSVGAQLNAPVMSCWRCWPGLGLNTFFSDNSGNKGFNIGTDYHFFPVHNARLNNKRLTRQARNGRAWPLGGGIYPAFVTRG